jgi:hypothetical protein
MSQQTPEQKPAEEENDRWSRRHHRHGSPGITGALIVIVLGVLLYLANQGILDWDKWWQYFLIGIGIVFLIDAAVRSSGETDRRFLVGRLFAGLILIGVGVTFLAGGSAYWPLIIIVVGVAMLITALIRRQSR